MANVYDDADAARRYDAARSLPEETKTVWLNAMRSALPVPPVKGILDLGCGTGRFTADLARVFDCPVVGVEPSEAMLDVARSQRRPHVLWKRGAAEEIPLEAQSVDLIFMSQVFHHLVQPAQALREIHRVLTSGGSLVIRNGTRENNEETEWLHCFPEALEVDRKRILSRQEIVNMVSSHSFEPFAQHTFSQCFAPTYGDYFKKIGGRGLSSLIAISDEAFDRGMARFRQWIDRQALDRAVYEQIDMFVFRRQ